MQLCMPCSRRLEYVVLMGQMNKVPMSNVKVAVPYREDDRDCDRSAPAPLQGPEHHNVRKDEQAGC